MPNTTPKNSDAINTTDEVQGEQKHRWWIVLPIVVVSMTIATVEPALMNDLMVRRFRYRYGILNGSSPSSESACNAPNLENNSQLIELSIKVQQSVSHLNILIAGVGAIPAVLTYVILGANCDRIGRRPLLIIPCLGRIIRYIILLILVQINLDDIWLIIADVVDGLFGSNSLLLLGAIAYISDCTNHQERGRAMILEEAAVALTRIFPLLGLGFWLQYHDYTLPMSICLGINVAALIYIYLFQPESYGPNKRELFHFVKQLKRVRLSAIRGTYRVFLTKRPGDNQRKLICLTVTQMSLFVILFGFVSIHALYLYGKPFCFNALDLAILTSAQFALMIFISIVLSFFQKSYLMNSLVIPIFGIFTYIIHLVIFGFAQRVWVLYLGKKLIVGKELFHHSNVFLYLQRYLLDVYFLWSWVFYVHC